MKKLTQVEYEGEDIYTTKFHKNGKIANLRIIGENGRWCEFNYNKNGEKINYRNNEGLNVAYKK